MVSVRLDNNTPRSADRTKKTRPDARGRFDAPETSRLNGIRFGTGEECLAKGIVCIPVQRVVLRAPVIRYNRLSFSKGIVARGPARCRLRSLWGPSKGLALLLLETGLHLRATQDRFTLAPYSSYGTCKKLSEDTTYGSSSANGFVAH